VTLRALYKEHFLFVEGAAVVGVSLVAGVLLWQWPPASAWVEPRLGGVVPIYQTLAGLFGSLLGFSLAATSIVASAAGGPTMAAVRDSRYYDDVWRILRSGTRAMIVATAVSLAAMVYERTGLPPGTDSTRMPSAWVALVVGHAVLHATARLGRVVWLLEKVIEVVSKQ
jgi:hypothetical protein